MATDVLKHADDTNFANLVLASPRPVLEELAQDYADKLDVVKVNVDDSRATATQYGIRSIPTLIMIRDGQVLGTRMGALPKAQLKQFIEEFVK